MKSRSRFLVVAFVLIIIGAGAGGWATRMRARTANIPSAEMKDNQLVKAFTEGSQLIEDNYAIDRDQEMLTKAAVLGMLHVLDPHSSFFDRRAFNEMQEEQSSRFYGIGVTINRRNDKTCVLGVVKGMPAERAGMKYGDIIVEVDGKPTKGWSQAEVLNHVRGERGTEVEIAVERVGEPVPVKFRIVRDEVPYPSVRNHFMVRPGIGFIALTNGFNKKTSEELQDAMTTLKKQGMNSLVLDLRQNPGGLLKQAIEVSEIFLPRSVEVVSVRGREGRVRSQVYKSENGDPESLPLVILINGNTASASEIVAGAIQDKDRGLIVGEDSFGKGLVQTVFPLPGGTGLTLTTAKYYTPSGRCIQRDYSGGSLYDYYWARRNGDPQATPSPTPDTDAVFTPTGRKLHGGGGITPDIVIKGSLENYAMRDACFEFARLLAGGALPGFDEYKVAKVEFGYRLRGTEFQISDGVVTAFRNFLREHNDLGISEALLNSHLEYARRRIRAELITAAYGIEAEEQFLLDSDPQAMQAVEAIPKAERLTATARLFETGPNRH
ncbi:MAG: S41 family peptidase [Acidobacteria bacterium]|nr:S41 family peptidase [Acidobacteriota bacterium]